MSTHWADRFGLGTGPIPVEPVTSPEYFELEREKIFRRTWLNVGRIDELPKPGSYIVKDIELLRTSLLFVRGEDDVVRAFHNVCRHRGNRLVGRCSGKAKGFACNFHGWTYDLEGKLVFVPDEGEFPCLEKTKLGLPPVATEVWQGFIFINLDPEPQQSLVEYLGEIGKDLEGYPFDSMEPVVTYFVDLKANWKVWVDAFQEGYHVPFVHKASVPKGFIDRDVAALVHLPALRIYERHRSLCVPGNPMFEPLPAEAEVLKHDPNATHGIVIPEERQPKGVNPDRIAVWAADVDVVFPNFFVFPSGGWYFTYTYWPLAVDRTLCEARFYMKKATTAADIVAQEYAKVVWRDAIREDFSRLEPLQHMLASGAMKEMVLSDQEVLIRHGHDVAARHVRD
jgi:phenylpropionate dioxygenase-like ring-hydroxylating dioxygenase large terminal subunit